jgi:hypothetical protein
MRIYFITERYGTFLLIDRPKAPKTIASIGVDDYTSASVGVDDYT